MNDSELKTLISNTSRFVMLQQEEQNRTNIDEEIIENLCKQIGRLIIQCPGEMRGFEERANYMIDNADRALEDLVSRKDSEFDNYIKKEPLGTIFVIAPWNYPFNTSVNSIVPSLLSGNTVILKHSSQTPLCAEQLFDAATKASLPKNIFQFLHLNHFITIKTTYGYYQIL